MYFCPFQAPCGRKIIAMAVERSGTPRYKQYGRFSTIVRQTFVTIWSYIAPRGLLKAFGTFPRVFATLRTHRYDLLPCGLGGALSFAMEQTLT